MSTFPAASPQILKFNPYECNVHIRTCASHIHRISPHYHRFSCFTKNESNFHSAFPQLHRQAPQIRHTFPNNSHTRPASQHMHVHLPRALRHAATLSQIRHLSQHILNMSLHSPLQSFPSNHHKLFELHPRHTNIHPMKRPAPINCTRCHHTISYPRRNMTNWHHEFTNAHPTLSQRHHNITKCHNQHSQVHRRGTLATNSQTATTNRTTVEYKLSALPSPQLNRTLIDSHRSTQNASPPIHIKSHHTSTKLYRIFTTHSPQLFPHSHNIPLDSQQIHKLPSHMHRQCRRISTKLRSSCTQQINRITSIHSGITKLHDQFMHLLMKCERLPHSFAKG